MVTWLYNYGFRVSQIKNQVFSEVPIKNLIYRHLQKLFDETSMASDSGITIGYFTEICSLYLPDPAQVLPNPVHQMYGNFLLYTCMQFSNQYCSRLSCYTLSESVCHGTMYLVQCTYILLKCTAAFATICNRNMSYGIFTTNCESFLSNCNYSVVRNKQINLLSAHNLDCADKWEVITVTKRLGTKI
jgi:hypothetical protein